MIIEKIERVIYYPCPGLCLKHQVNFSSKNIKNKRRKGEASLFTYPSNKYSDIDQVSKLVLDSNDYLLFELTNVDKNYKNDASICLSYPHILNLKKIFDEALSWFDDYEDLFIQPKDYEGVVLNNKYSNLSLVSNKFINNRYIIIEPEIYETEEEILEGIRIYFSNSLSINMSSLQLESLYDFLDNFNLYEASQNLINYYMLFMNNQKISVPIFKFRKETIKERRNKQRNIFPIQSDINEEE